MSPSEFDFIARLARQVKRRTGSRSETERLAAGIGDDAAVITQHSGRDLLVSSDLLVEGVDFLTNFVSPALLGHKALAVSLSDISAMGGRPYWAFLSIGVPQNIWNTNFVDEFYKGFFKLARKYNVVLAGGDISRTPDRIVVDSTVIGETGRGLAVLRSGAQTGDHIFVTGWLGGAAAGLMLLNKSTPGKTIRPKGASRKQLLMRHFSPEPRVGWGELLGRKRLATAMIDLSDGLSSDLRHLCQSSNVGAELHGANIPLDPDLVKPQFARRWDPLELALNGGEDFELLFTVAPENLRLLPHEVEGIPATNVGTIAGKRSGITITVNGRRKPLKNAGFKHFG